jgi:hypothetical protein
VKARQRWEARASAGRLLGNLAGSRVEMFALLLEAWASERRESRT